MDDSTSDKISSLTGHPVPVLPDQPVVAVRADGLGVRADLRSLWQRRELLYFLTLRDIKLRYKQTVLGVAWAVIQPLVTMVIFTFLFGRFVGVSSEGIPYSAFAYAGLLLWTFLANAINTSSNSLVGNINLITKVYFPRVIIPTAAVLSGLLDFVIGSAALIGLIIYHHAALSLNLNMILAPFFVFLTVLLALGVGMWLAALNVRYRDVRHALPFLIQIWMFLSPVIYPSTVIPERWRWVLALNPLTGIMEGFRACLFGHPINWPETLIATTITVAILFWANYSFRQTETGFADYI